MLVVGEKEAQENKVAVRHRTDGDKGAMPVDGVIARLKEEIAARK
jgi:threonyl-tRNA synthetase